MTRSILPSGMFILPLCVLRLSFLISCCRHSDGHIAIWNLQSHERVTQFTGHKSEVTALNFNQQNSLLVSGSKDTTIVVCPILDYDAIISFRSHMARCGILSQRKVCSVCWVTRMSSLKFSSSRTQMRWSRAQRIC
jgi:WD40 repeat protein